MRKSLNGFVVGDQDLWLYDFFDVPAFSPQTVRTAVEANPDGEDLVLEINSGGGSVFAGFEMYSVLRNAKCQTVAEVQSLAASAASVVMLGCQRVTASPVAQVMIHLPLTTTDGNRYDHQESIGVLDSITESILNAYTMKCGALSTRDELKRMMRTSTWMTAPEAKGLGLVDSILGEETIDPSAILNCAGNLPHGIRAMGTRAMPSPQSLQQEYDRLVDAGLAPARVSDGEKPMKNDPVQMEPAIENTDLQAAVARLELEKIRF